MIKKKSVLIVFGLLLLFSNVFSAAPTVDFNWTPQNPIAFQPTIFDPTITTSSTLNNLRWAFNSDGNTNYFGDLNYQIITSDNFQDGDYTSNPVWTVKTGTFSVVTHNGNLALTSGGLGSVIQTYADINTVKNDINITWQDYRTGSEQSRISFGTDSNSLWSISNFNCESTTCSLGLLAGGSFATTTDEWHKYNIYTQDGNVFVYENEVQKLNLVKTSDLIGNNVLWGTGNGSNNAYLDDLNVQAILVSADMKKDTNQTHSFTTSGLKSVCLTAGNTDGNSTTCHDVNVGGNASIQVFDENTGIRINNATMTFNNSTFTTTTGVFSIETPAVSAEYPFVISATNYPARTFWFYVDTNTSFSKSIYLLDANKTTSYDFVLRDSLGSKFNINGVYYSNKLFRIEKNGYLVTQTYSDTSNLVYGVQLATLTQDYNFFVDYNTNNVNLFDYNDAILTVQVPKNEKTLEPVTPFGIHVTNLTAIDLNNLTTSKSFKIYPNTKTPYLVNIDANTTGYFSRNYSIRADGGQSNMLDSSTNIILQPYLLRQIDNASQATFTLSDSLTGNKVPFYTIEFRTGVRNATNVLVESPLSDSAGNMIFSTITNKEYALIVRNDVGDIVKRGQMIFATSSVYFLDVFTGTITLAQPNMGRMDINVLIPQNNIFYLNDQNDYVFRFKVFSSFFQIGSVRVQVVQNGVTLKDVNFVPSSFATSLPSGTLFDINFSGASPLYIASVIVKVSSAGGVITKTFSYPVRSSHDPKYSLPNFQPLLNDIGRLGGIVLWFLGCIILVGLLRFVPTYGVDNNAMVWIVVIYTGVVAWMGLIDTTVALIAIIGGISLWIFQRRPIG